LCVRPIFVDMNSTPLDTAWRKTASAVYRKPVDSKMLGSVSLDVTALEQFIRDQRQAGAKITMTHFFVLALARGFDTAVPELNCYLRLGKITPRPGVDATLSVLIKGGTEMGSVLVTNAHRHTLTTLANWLNEELQKSRKGQESATMSNKNLLSGIPWPFRNWLVRVVKLVTIDLGLSFPPLGLSAGSFGSFVLTNIGSIGIDIGYPALLPLSNVSSVISMGQPQSKAVVINNEIHIRRILTLSAAIDHRIADASHAGRLFNHLKKMVREPHLLNELPDSGA